jgi:hypothetical protein
MTVERAKIDRVCGLSKQVIVIQKQDCAGLVLAKNAGVGRAGSCVIIHAVPTSSLHPCLVFSQINAGLANDNIYVSDN